MSYHERQQQKLTELKQLWDSLSERIQANIAELDTESDAEKRRNLKKRNDSLIEERNAIDGQMTVIEEALTPESTRSVEDTDVQLEALQKAIERLETRLTPPSSYTATDLQAYLDFLINRCATLDPRRMRSGGGVTQQVVIPLEQVFISLCADPDNPLEREADRRLLDTDVKALAKSEHIDELTKEQQAHFRYRVLIQEYLMLVQQQGQTARAELTDAFARYRYLAILGDPGCGKTTLTRWLALRLASALKEEQPRVLFLKPNAEQPIDLGPTRLPILMRIADYAEARRKSTPTSTPLAVWDYLGFQPVQGETLTSVPNERLHALMTDFLARGQAVVLLDGLDEITEETERVEIVHAIESFIGEHIRTPEGTNAFDDWVTLVEGEEDKPDAAVLRRRWRRGQQPGPAQTGGNQVVVTSRVAGYRAAPLRGDIVHLRVQDMADDAVDQFCDHWALAVEAFLLRDSGLPDDEVRARAQTEANHLKTAIRASEGVRKLAANPLLLTILALIHREQTRLPERRVELYQQAVQTLVQLWRDTGLDEEQAIDVLGPLARWIHENQPTGLATEDEVRAEITRALAEWEGVSPDELPGKFKKQVTDFIRAVREQSGLLVARGEGLFGFMHLTFQEYFVARDLTRDGSAALELIPKYLHRPRWREPLLLAVAYLSKAQRGLMEKVFNVLLNQPTDYDPLLHRNLLFAAACIPEAVWVPPRQVREIGQQLVDLYLDENAGRRYPTLRTQIEAAVRALRRHETATRLLDEILTEALDSPDDTRSLTTAQLILNAEWATEAIARKLLRVLSRDAAPDWPIDVALKTLSNSLPSTLLDQLLPFRSTYFTNPLVANTVKTFKSVQLLLRALYNKQRFFSPNTIYRDSPLTPGLIAVLLDLENDDNLVDWLQGQINNTETQIEAALGLVVLERWEDDLLNKFSIKACQNFTQQLLRLFDVVTGFKRKSSDPSPLDILDQILQEAQEEAEQAKAEKEAEEAIIRNTSTYRKPLYQNIKTDKKTNKPRPSNYVIKVLTSTLQRLDVTPISLTISVLNTLDNFELEATDSLLVLSNFWRALASSNTFERQQATEATLKRSSLSLPITCLEDLKNYMSNPDISPAETKRVLARLHINDKSPISELLFLETWVAQNSFLSAYGAVFLQEFGYLTTHSWPVLLRAACVADDDALHQRASRALSASRSVSQAGASLVEQMARDTYQINHPNSDMPATPRVLRYQVEWALAHLDHDAPNLLQQWVDDFNHLQPAEAENSFLGTILSNLHKASPESQEVILAALPLSAPHTQSALLNAFCKLLQYRQLPTERQSTLASAIIGLLTPTLESQNQVLMINCLAELEKPSPEVIEVLLRMLESSPLVTIATCAALAKQAVLASEPFTTRIKASLHTQLRHSDLGVSRAASGALCWMTLVQAPQENFNPALVLEQLASDLPEPVGLLHALLQACTDDQEWTPIETFREKVMACVRTLVVSQSSLLSVLLDELEDSLKNKGWPARRVTLAALAAVAEAMPAQLLEARPLPVLEELLVRGTLDEQSFNSRRMALTALSHLKTITPPVVEALLAAVQDISVVQQDAIKSARRFRQVQTDALPPLLRALHDPSAATAHAAALVLAELGAGRQALDDPQLRHTIAQALAEALVNPESHREVWLNSEPKGYLDETLFEALSRVTE